MVQERTNDPHVLPIVKLVRDAVSASGKSLREFAAERRIAYSTLRYYHDQRLEPLSQPPRKETLRELALALDVPLGDMEQAALESLSYRTAPPKARPRVVGGTDRVSTIEDAIRSDPTLPEVAKAHLLSQVALLRHLRDGLPPELEAEQEGRKRAAVAAQRKGGRSLRTPTHAESVADTEATMTLLAGLSDESDNLTESPRPPRPSRRK